MSQRSYSLFVLEGPAGCGKSSAIQEASKRYGLDVIERDYTVPSRAWGSDAPLASMVKDYRLFFKYLTEAEPNRPYLMDRLFFSQLVYQPTRAQISLSTPRLKILAREMKYSLETILFRLRDEEFIRTLKLNDDPTNLLRFNIVFLFFCPSVNVLERFRAHSSKRYPFNAEMECEAYTVIGNFLMAENSEKTFSEVSVKAEVINYSGEQRTINLASKLYNKVALYESEHGFSLSKP